MLLFQQKTLTQGQPISFSNGFDPNAETLYSFLPSHHQNTYYTPPTIQNDDGSTFTQIPFSLFTSPQRIDSTFENTLNDFLGPAPIYDSYDSPPKYTTHGTSTQKPFGSLNSSFFKNTYENQDNTTFRAFKADN